MITNSHELSLKKIEFLVASLQKEKVLTKDRIEKAFKLIDSVMIIYIKANLNFELIILNNCRMETDRLPRKN